MLAVTDMTIEEYYQGSSLKQVFVDLGLIVMKKWWLATQRFTGFRRLCQRAPLSLNKVVLPDIRHNNCESTQTATIADRFPLTDNTCCATRLLPFPAYINPTNMSLIQLLTSSPHLIGSPEIGEVMSSSA